MHREIRKRPKARKSLNLLKHCSNKAINAPFSFSDKENENGTQESVAERQARQRTECKFCRSSDKENENGTQAVPRLKPRDNSPTRNEGELSVKRRSPSSFGRGIIRL